MEQAIDLDKLANQRSKQFIGQFAWPTVLLSLCVMGMYLGTPLLVKAAILPLWVGVLVMALCTYGAYTTLHEAVHGSVSGSHPKLRWVNEAVGYCAGLILGLPMTAHRHEHLAHHRNTNDPLADPDYEISEMGNSLWHTLRSSFLFTSSQFRYYHRHRWAIAPAAQNRRFWLEIVASATLRFGLIAWLGWGPGITLLIAAPLLGVILTQYLFAYLVHLPHEAMGRYVDTATFIVPGWMGKWVTIAWGYQNYHSIHHLFPRVPFYRYPALFNQIEQIMLTRGAPVYRLAGFRWELLSQAQ